LSGDCTNDIRDEKENDNDNDIDNPPDSFLMLATAVQLRSHDAIRWRIAIRNEQQQHQRLLTFHSVSLSDVPVGVKIFRGGGNDLRAEPGSLMYPSTNTRPDFTHATIALSRVAAHTTEEHHQFVRRILRYLNGTTSLGLLFHSSPPSSQSLSPSLFADTDADFGTGPHQESTSGCVVYLTPDGSRELATPILWKSKRQTITTLSTTEAEFVALSECVLQVLQLRTLLSELGHPQLQPTPISSSAVKNVTGDPLQFTSKLLHIGTKYHFVRNQQAAGHILVQKIDTSSNTADGFTKPLGPQDFKRHFRSLLSDGAKLQ